MSDLIGQNLGTSGGGRPYTLIRSSQGAGVTAVYTNDFELAAVVAYNMEIELEIGAIGFVIARAGGPPAVDIYVESNLAGIEPVSFSWRGMQPLDFGQTFEVENGTAATMNVAVTGWVYPFPTGNNSTG